MYFRNFLLPKTWLDQYLKSLVSEDPSNSKTVNAAKNCSNLKECFFTIFIVLSQGNYLTKSFC